MILVPHYSIKEPIWSTNSIGLNAKEMDKNTVDGLIFVEITYRNKDGVRIFPNIFVQSAKYLKKFPTVYRKQTKLHIIPIRELSTL